MAWKPIKGALTAPIGMRWWNNGQSRFGGNYRHELRPEPQPIGKGADETQSDARDQDGIVTAATEESEDNMLIISSDGRLAVESSFITKIEATSKGKVTAWTKSNGTAQADAYLGSYDNDLQAGLAMNMLVDAIVEDKSCTIWQMPSGDEPFMQIDPTIHGGGTSARKQKTTGKTK